MHNKLSCNDRVLIHQPLLVCTSFYLLEVFTTSQSSYIFLFTGAHNKKNVREERDTTTHLIQISVFTHVSRVTVYILRPRRKSRLVGPDYEAFHGSENTSKLTESPKNGAQAFCGATGLFVSRFSCASTVCAKIGQRRSLIIILCRPYMLSFVHGKRA